MNVGYGGEIIKDLNRNVQRSLRDYFKKLSSAIKAQLDAQMDDYQKGKRKDRPKDLSIQDLENAVVSKFKYMWFERPETSLVSARTDDMIKFGKMKILKKMLWTHEPYWASDLSESVLRMTPRLPGAHVLQCFLVRYYPQQYVWCYASFPVEEKLLYQKGFNGEHEYWWGIIGQPPSTTDIGLGTFAGV
ncbi:uncharacterized protein Z520_11724 [Fonsecaea multimorphosa CBS 102226]|uniref:Uncharacterized protein n=1 Tax=Fonsecaea multimorphosa CBS 102226 TaxID=1442371 RepID=A0A0D2K8A6_9EURO|nr:uncharacterized protein Z520_11724 [Fonsecaea multimorphosa CBS 102226]KIX92548.1 hypothetical protein Z520_11724 [Fonsecaea multimorphosa CBS 102226]